DRCPHARTVRPRWRPERRSPGRARPPARTLSRSPALTRGPLSRQPPGLGPDPADSLAPGSPWPWLISLNVDRCANRRSTLADVSQLTRGDRLDHHVAQRCGFDRPGDDWSLAGIRGELAEQAVLAAATHDVDALQRTADETLEVLECRSISDRQALETAANDLSDGLRRPLAAPGRWVAHDGRPGGWGRRFRARHR